jgi:hypothetical protein
VSWTLALGREPE